MYFDYFTNCDGKIEAIGSIDDDFGKDVLPIPDGEFSYEDDFSVSDSEANPDDILALIFGADSESVVKE